MRRTPGPLLLVTLLVALLAGCGDDDGGTTGDGPPPSSPSSDLLSPGPTGEPPAPDQPLVVALLSETGAGGVTADVLTPVEGAGLAPFLAQLDSAELSEEVRAAVDGYTVPEGRSLGAAVVAVACDVPGSVAVTQEGEEWTVTAAKVPSPLPECYAPVTTVAVVDVPGELVPPTAAGGR